MYQSDGSYGYGMALPFIISTTYHTWKNMYISSLKVTAKAPENGWLEYDRFLLGPGLFSGAISGLASV